MNHNPLSVDTHRIVSQLAQFDGAAALNVVARCYPRVAPADGGTGFQQLRYDFPRDRIPEAMLLPGDAEITITVQGALGNEVAKPLLKTAVEKVLTGPAGSNAWDARVYFDGHQQGGLMYEVKVFTTPAC